MGKLLALQIQLIAEVGMRFSQGDSALFLQWYDLYRRCLLFRGKRGEELQAALRKVLDHQVI